MKLSIVMPAYNEQKRIEKALGQVLSFSHPGWETEIIVINDGSRDKTLAIMQGYRKKIEIVSYPANRGKGYAIRQGIKKARGEFVLIQDADLEYQPKDIPKLLAKTGEAKAIYGSRFLGSIKNMSLGSRFGNLFLSRLASLLYGQRLTDMETGYKLIQRDTLQELRLESDDFKIEPEITIKLLKQKIRIVEVPIDYLARAKEEKKISFRDGIAAAWFLIKKRFGT
jgi:glycosyltransferase involved in cell wall biosynthesis